MHLFENFRLPKWDKLRHYGSVYLHKKKTRMMTLLNSLKSSSEHLLNGKQLLSLFVLMHWLACLCVSMDDSLLHYAILVKLLN